MLPLSLLRAAIGSPLLVELKSGETYNGRLVSCDAWMNMNLRDVICTSRDGDKFWKLPSCYIRGSAVKYLRLPPDLLGKAAEMDEQQQQQHKFSATTNNAGGRGRGRGRGGGRDAGTPGRGGGRGRGRGGGRGRDGGGRDGGRDGGRGRGRGRAPPSSDS